MTETSKRSKKAAGQGRIQEASAPGSSPSFEQIMRGRGFLPRVDAGRRVGRDLYFVTRAITAGVKAEKHGFYWYVSMESLAQHLGPAMCKVLGLTKHNKWGIDAGLPEATAAAAAAASAG